MARQVAHEIKNPLTPIQLSAEHLRRVHADRGEPLGAVLEGLRRLDPRAGAAAAADLVGVLAASRRHRTAQPAPVDVPELVAEVVDPYRTGLAGRIAIDNQRRRPLPRVLVDRTLIARALANIVENALHAMPGQGGSDRRRARPKPAWSRLDVRDTGVGMDEEALARVFEPYFSTKTTGHRPRAADRAAQRRAEWRHDRGREREGRGDDGRVAADCRMAARR